jgi:hypothetical protein
MSCVVKFAGIVGGSRKFLPLAMLLVLLVPAYSQQEVDPTWYDPWTTASKATVHHLQEERIADRAHRKKINSAAVARTRKRKPRTPTPSDPNPQQKLSARN